MHDTDSMQLTGVHESSLNAQLVRVDWFSYSQAAGRGWGGGGGKSEIQIGVDGQNETPCTPTPNGTHHKSPINPHHKKTFHMLRTIKATVAVSQKWFSCVPAEDSSADAVLCGTAQHCY